MNTREILAVCDQVLTARTLDDAQRIIAPIVSIRRGDVDPATFERVRAAKAEIMLGMPSQFGSKPEIALAEGAPDPDDPQAFYKAFVASAAAASGSEAQVLQQFREGVIAYIKWVSGNEHERADAVAVKRAATFEEIQQVLAKYDDQECSFLSMVAQGYFV